MDGGSDVDAAEAAEILARAPAVILRADAEGTILWASRAVERVMGYTAAEMVGLRVEEVVAPEDLDRAREHIRAVMGGQTPAAREYRLIRKDGRIAFVFVDTGPWIEAGVTTGMVLALTDVREIAAERLVHRQARRLNDVLLHTFHELVFELDGEGHVLGHHTRHPELLFVPPDQWLGRTVYEMMPGPVADGLRATLEACDETSAEGRFEYSLPIGDPPLHYEAHVAIVDADGSSIVAIRDVTGRHEAAARLARSERLAALGTLAAGLAHEINNPLTTMIANLDLLQEFCAGLGSAERTEAEGMFAEFSAAARQVKRVVQSLGAFAAPRSSGPRTGSADLNDAVERALAIARTHLRHRARVELHLGAPPTVGIDDHRLVEIILNLLINAGQAFDGEDPGRNEIAVETSTDDATGRGRLLVRDNGAGIPEAEVGRVFDPFYTTKAAGDGMGLGLSIVHMLVEDSAGTIEVESEVGRGSCFIVELPATTAPVEVEPETTSRAVDVLDKRILVVDDEQALGTVICRLLSGNEVRHVLDAAAAYRSLAEGAWDLVICDVMLPGVTAAELYPRAVQSHPELEGRFLFITGGALTERTRAFVNDPSLRCLYKPFRPHELHAAVSEFFR